MRMITVVAAAILFGMSQSGPGMASNARRPIPIGSAMAFIDSIGIQVHLHYTDTAYGDARYPTVRDRLLALGVRHLRDAVIDTRWLPYYAHIQELAEHGMRFDLLTSIGTPSELLRDYPAHFPGAIEAYEGPNESNTRQIAGWPQNLILSQQQLYRAVHTYPELRGIKVIGPSFTTEEAAHAIGDLSKILDFGNAHIYFAGRNPGTSGWGATGPYGTYGSLEYNIALAAVVAPHMPVIVTESGYPNDPRDRDAVPPYVAARYLPRLLLDNWQAGIMRTYLYELVDVGKGGDPDFGLLDADGGPKPAYFSIQNFIAAADAVGVPSEASDLHCNLESTSDARVVILAGSARRFVLAAWRELPGWSVPDHVPIEVPPVKAIVECDHLLEGDSERTLGDDGKPSPPIMLEKGRSVAITISDRVTLLSFREAPAH